MKEVLLPDGFTLEYIRKSHPRKHFYSSQPEVDDWLRTKALQHAVKHLSSTRVLLDPSQQIAGFYTLASKEVDFSELPIELTSQLPDRPLPVAILAWLGVELKYQRKGWGARLLANALTDCFQASSSLPFVAVCLDCLTEEAKQFYQHWQFEQLPDNPKRLFLSHARLHAMMNS